MACYGSSFLSNLYDSYEVESEMRPVLLTDIDNFDMQNEYG